MYTKRIVCGNGTGESIGRACTVRAYHPCFTIISILEACVLEPHHRSDRNNRRKKPLIKKNIVRAGRFYEKVIQLPI